MAKGQMNVAVDGDVLDYHRAKHTNLSKTVNDYLRALMGVEMDSTKAFNEERMAELEKELAMERTKKIEYEQVLKTQATEREQTDFKTDIAELREIHKQWQAGSKYHERLYVEKFQASMDKYKINRAELLAYVEGKKVM